MKARGGEVVVRALVEHDVKTIYGLPGSHILDIYNALRDETCIRNILAMHESNAAFMADAHGRLTGEPGICLVTGGPGATNAITAIAQAYTEASPVVQITGHASTRKKIQPDHGVDDWDFLLKIYRPITKWSMRIERIEDIPPILDKAFNLAASGRPGPVHLEIPRDILASSGKIPEFKTSPKPESPETRSCVKAVADILQSATNPVIAVGRGVLREFCSNEVIELAKALGAPIVTLPGAISAIPYQCPLYLGYDLSGIRWMVHPAVNALVKKADVILTLGFDVGERLTFFREEKSKLINIHNDAPAIDLDKAATQKLKPTINVKATIKDFVILLERAINEKRVNVSRLRLETRIADIKKKIRGDIARSIRWGNKPIHPGEISTELRRVLDDDAIITLDVGDSSDWMKICCRAKRPNTILAPGRYSSMGFSLPAAIAAKINFPERQVVSVTGDGGFLMSYMDFPTIVRYRLEIIVIVENNRRYGMIWNMQRANYKGRTFATEIGTPNLAEYARVSGATGIKVRDPKDLRNALQEAVNVKGPVLVDIDTDHEYPSYMPTRLLRFLRKIKHCIYNRM